MKLKKQEEAEMYERQRRGEDGYALKVLNIIYI
jgi:hypothetical protein